MATKIDFTIEFKLLNSEPLLDDIQLDAILDEEQVRKLKTQLQPGKSLAQAMFDAQVKQPVTLRLICVNALQSFDRDSSGTERFERYRLALRIHERDQVELSSEEITMLKSLIGKLYAPLYVGQAWLLLDPPAEES